VKSRFERLQRGDQILCSMKFRDYTRGNADTAALVTIDEAFQLARSGVLCASRKALRVFVKAVTYIAGGHAFDPTENPAPWSRGHHRQNNDQSQ
jgi:hypothetical protein